jgi:pentatricopeptide repeat protein
MAAAELQANIDRRVAKLALLGDSEDSKRTRKREFAAIGKIRKQLAALPKEASSTAAKRPRLEADFAASDGPSSTNKKSMGSTKTKGSQRSSSSAEDNDDSEVEDSNKGGGGGALSRKQEKQLVKTVNQKLAVAATRKQLKAALKVFASLAKRGLQGDVHTYTNVINCAVRCGHLAQAQQLYAHLRGVRGLAPNVVTLTALLKGYCEAGDVSGGKAMLDAECAAHRLVPNLRTANTLLRGCVRSGNTAVAVAALHEMAHGWAVAADASCVVAVVGLLSRSLRLADAQRVLATYAPVVAPAAHASVAKCAAVLGDWSACGKALASADAAVRAAAQQRQAARVHERVRATQALGAEDQGGGDDGFGNGKVRAGVTPR